MAYQNVGKPRIFVDYFQYNLAIGNMEYWSDSYHPASPINNFMNPLKPFVLSAFPGAGSTTDQFGMYFFASRNPYWGMNYSGFLGHNFGGIPVSPTLLWYRHDWDAYESGADTNPFVDNFGGGQTYHHWDDGVTPNNPVNIINAQSGGDIDGDSNQAGTHLLPKYNGFSLWQHDEITKSLIMDTNVGEDDWLSGFRMHINRGALDNTGVTLTSGTHTIGGTFTCGRMYDFEHAPDMKVTMERVFDGVKRQKTIGGADISNTVFLGPPNWPLSGNPWTLTEANHGFAGPVYAGGRMGRRKWKLKFSMLSDRVESGNGLMSVNELATPYGVDSSEAAGYASEDWETVSNEDVFTTDNWTDDSFMGCVFQKTMGFTLPFIFQPDSNNNSADQFAICKIDNKSLQIKQSSFKKYDISLTIREVW